MSFVLPAWVKEKYINRESPFGFNGLGLFVYKRTYSRIKPDGTNEVWADTVERVVNGCYSMQKNHVVEHGLGWDDEKGIQSAVEMYDAIFNLRFTPPGRGLWAMGTKITEEKGIFAALNNCAFVSTEGIATDKSKPFRFLKDMSMLGVGCGFDVKGAGKLVVPPNKKFSKINVDNEDIVITYKDNPVKREIVDKYVKLLQQYIDKYQSILDSVEQSNTYIITSAKDSIKMYSDELSLVENIELYDIKTHVIEDTREGWVSSVGDILDSYFNNDYFVVFDYSKIRPAGQPLKTFGGLSSGAEPLIDLHIMIRVVMNRNVGGDLTERTIVDIMNLIGKCVVAGNVRRCLPEDTLIHTTDGLIPIKDITTNMSVVTHKGNFKVTNVFDQGIQECIEVKSQLGSFWCTPNHKIAVFTNIKKYEFKRADQLVAGDRLVFSQHHITGSVDKLPEFKYDAPKHSTTCKNITIPELDVNIAWLFGYFHGDGNIYTGNPKDGIKDTWFNSYVGFAVDAKHKHIHDKICEQIARFGVNVTITQPTENDKCFKIRTQSKQMAMYFSQFKKSNTEITIPYFIKKGSSELRAAYLAGLFDADGCCSGTINLVASVYPLFLDEVQSVYASLGIPAFKFLNRPAKGNWHALYHLNLKDPVAINKFKTNVSIYSLKFIENRKTTISRHGYGYPMEWCKNLPHIHRMTSTNNAQLQIHKYIEMGNDHENLIPISIIEVTNNKKMYHTYDIEVEQEHMFVMGNGLISHNSSEIALGPVDSIEFMNLKNYELNPDRMAYGWCSNNSVFGTVGMNYNDIAKRIKDNGEPGIIWMENAKNYSRMGDEPDYKDIKAMGSNPCCFSGDTLIAVADGRNAVSIRQLAEEGNDVPVWSLNTTTMKPEIKWGRLPHRTGENQRVMKITLDDGSSITVTPDHKMMLKGGKYVFAHELTTGDSLERFDKKLHGQYFKVDKDTSHEHYVLAKFYYPEEFNRIEQAYINGGRENNMLINVHHKDENKTNNTKDNLQLMTKGEHARHHGQQLIGDKNPMYGKIHSEETRRKIGDKTIERYQDPIYAAKHKGSYSDEMKAAMSIQMQSQKAINDHEYYVQLEKTCNDSGLTTRWVDSDASQNKILKIVINCETCNNEMLVAWNARNTAFCSRVCKNKDPIMIEKRTEGQHKYFADKQLQTRHDQIVIYNELKNELARDPLKKEWENRCRERKISFRLRPTGGNEHVFKNYEELKIAAIEYNHSIIAIEYLDEPQDVYNLTVPINHTIGIITNVINNTTFSGIYTRQSEQTLESYELCCLVEVYIAKHKTKSEFLRTLKFAYLYAKTVTLGGSHWVETNRVMKRNRRIGCSLTGLVQFLGTHSMEELREWCNEGYKTIQKWDEIYSDFFTIPRSIKTTSIKPSGCVIPSTCVEVSDTDNISETQSISMEGLFGDLGVDLKKCLRDEVSNTWFKPSNVMYAKNKNGEMEPIVNLYVNGIDECYEIMLENGDTVTCTGNHKWLVDRDGEKVWVETQHLRMSDRIYGN